MTELEKIEYNKLTDGERLDVITIITTALHGVTPELCLTTFEMNTVLKRSGVDFNNAVGRSHKQQLTGVIQGSDEKRSSAREKIEDAANYFSTNSNPALSASGIRLSEIYTASFAGLNVNNNSEESVGIERFIDLMETPEGAELVLDLYLPLDYANLKDGHNVYVEKNIERANIKENDASINLVPSRREVRRNIRFLESFLNFKVREGSEFHANLVEQLNGPISEIEAIASARETRKENLAS
jgi:hypothetical protein